MEPESNVGTTFSLSLSLSISTIIRINILYNKTWLVPILFSQHSPASSQHSSYHPPSVLCMVIITQYSLNELHLAILHSSKPPKISVYNQCTVQNRLRSVYIINCRLVQFMNALIQSSPITNFINFLSYMGGQQHALREWHQKACILWTFLAGTAGNWRYK